MALHSSSMSTSEPRSQWIYLTASVRWFFPKHQRGVSGILTIKITSRAGNRPPARASHFQLQKTPKTVANKMPIVTANWFTEPSIPRSRGGEISAIYTYESRRKLVWLFFNFLLLVDCETVGLLSCQSHSVSVFTLAPHLLCVFHPRKNTECWIKIKHSEQLLTSAFLYEPDV